MNGRTAFSDAATTTFVTTLILGIATGSDTDGYATWGARFAACAAASYLFWHYRYQRKRGTATDTDAD